MIPFWPRLETRVEPIGIDDAEEMSAIHDEAFARGWGADEIAALMAGPGVLALGAWRVYATRRKRLLGFVLIRQAADEAEVLTIAVRAGFRRRGCGRMLMDEALRRLYGDRVRVCFLEVDRDNAGARTLYRRLGFEEVGERPGYYADGGSALVMQLAL